MSRAANKRNLASNLIINAATSLANIQTKMDELSTQMEKMGLVVSQKKPTIVCLCGSTKFWREFQRAGLRETLKGKIVLSIGAASGTDDEHFGNMAPEEYTEVKKMLDELHLRKIEMADEILVLNTDGYIGESTRKEIRHAYILWKKIRWLEKEHAHKNMVEALAENPSLTFVPERVTLDD